MSDWDQFRPAASTSEWDQFKTAGSSGVMEDVVKSTAVGAGEGAIGLVGLMGDLAAVGKPDVAAPGWLDRKLSELFPGAVKAATNAVASAQNSQLGQQVAQSPAGLPTTAGLTKEIEQYTGEFYKPQSTEGKFGRSVGQFLPGAAIPFGGGPLMRGASAITGGIGAEAAGQASGDNPYWRAAGGVGASLAPSMLARTITPNAISAERQAMVDTLRREGVPLTAGQTTGREALRYAESSLGNAPLAGGRATAVMENQAEAFTRAALRRVGEDAPRATPEVIDGAFTRIGNQFEALAQRNALPASPRLGNDLVRVESEYNNLVSAANRAPVVANTIRDIGDEIVRNGGQLTGAQYNAFTSRLARQARNAATDPQLRDAIQGIRNALDDAMERHLVATGNSADHAAWREARNQYRNLMVIEKAATGAGENAAQGLISPSQLRNATVAQSRRAYARGQGDFADLARAGEATMRPLPQSGTTPRAAAMAVPSVLGAGVGSLLGGPAGAGLGAFIGTAAAGSAPGITGRVLMSRPVQSYLGNQLVAPPPMNRALAQSLLFGAMTPRLSSQ